MTSREDAVRLAVDVGGTFTDIVLEANGRRHAHKVLTTPRAPERAIIDGARAVLDLAGMAFADINVFIHGTTLATNAIIERKGARTALIATDGFRDVLEIADESRFDQYDINIVKTVPLVARNWRFTVPERIDASGAVRLPLDETAVKRAAERLISLDIEAVAVALMHSYANADHERRIGAILAKECPGVSVTLSSDVCPEAREYERTSTAVANAYIRPLMAGYLGRLQSAVCELGYSAPIHLMTSGGSLASLDTAMRYPIRLVESGPAGGAILAGRLALERGENRVLSFDMGGTTAKICLIEDGVPRLARIFEIDRQSRFKKGSGSPVRIPAIEMVEIGAGGGSIARVDGMKRILVGPDSAGAEPGPACYARGGTEPTVTDADLVLGKIDPANFAGGRMALDASRAETALAVHVGAALAGSAEVAAFGVSEIVDENMSNAARVHAVERGAAVADRTLIAFGGAAPLHASRLAEKLGIRRVIIPADAGVGSALGFLAAPAAYEQVRSRYMRLDRFDPGAANALLDEMERHATEHCRSAAGAAAMTARRLALMRYAGQGHEIAIALPDEPLAATTVGSLRNAFETEYTALFARHIPGAAIEIMSWMVTVTTSSEPPPPIGIAAKIPALTPMGERRIYDTRLGRALTAPVIERARLEPGMQTSGPVIIIEGGTATYVSPSFDVAVDAGYALVLTAKS